jgi:hypothetical protein
MKKYGVIGQKTNQRRHKSRFERQAGNQVYFLIVVIFHASGSGSALLMLIRIQDNQINAVPYLLH